MRTHPLLGRILPEALFLAYSVSEHLRSRSARKAGPSAVKRLLEQRRAFLRKLLPEYPLWALGHVRLGHTEAEIQTYSDGPIAPRLLSTIRLSAEAVTILLASEAAAGRFGRALCEAAYLRAQAELYRKNYDSALIELEWVLKPEHAVQVSRPVYYAALDHAANVCLILGRNEDSARYRLMLPPLPYSRATLAA